MHRLASAPIHLLSSYLFLLHAAAVDAFVPPRVVVLRPPPPRAVVTRSRSVCWHRRPTHGTSGRADPHLTSTSNDVGRWRRSKAPPAGSLLAKKSAEVEEESLSTSFSTTVHIGRVLLRCLWAILAYMAVGVGAFSGVFERWPIVDSLYFSVVTFTTVGYGDLIPSTEAGKLFTTFYSFFGISIVGALLGYVGGAVVEAERHAIQRTRAAARAAMMEIFDPKKNRGKIRKLSRVSKTVEGDVGSNGGSAASKLPGLRVLRNLLSRTFALRKRSDGSKSLLRSAFDIFAGSYYIFVPFLALAMIMGRYEGWSPITSVYYAMATATTVGYGDVFPTSPRMRLLAVVFIPLAVISMGEILGRIAGYFIRKESNRAEREFMQRRMMLQDLEAMDTNADGEVDLFEFLTFMLGSMQKVDKELMEDLKALFERLDASGDGYLQKEDLVLLAMRKRDPWSLRFH